MLRSRYRKWPTDALRVGITVYSGPVMRLLFADVLAGMQLELLSRELPDIAANVGGYVVAQGWGLE